jgi:hypothetical protein
MTPSGDRREELLDRAYRRGYALRRRRNVTATLAGVAMVLVVGSAAFAVSRPHERRTLSVAPTTTTTAGVPPMSELDRALRAFGVDVDAAPPAAVVLGDARFCGAEQRDSTGRAKVNEEARHCFIDHYDSRSPAVFVVRQPSVEGDPIVTVYRSQRAGSVVTFINATKDRFGSGTWARATCGKLKRDFPHVVPPLPASSFTTGDCTAFTNASG